ncbi:GntR family transcriptional regulator [Roseomonas nepalensis]|uniref:GntR family transcriptional regulator n=1 Tax=Muricoccus nepalensis TaxID=1854500 RepID=A0A502GDY9_9PROT|nr:GntR family transcriptional regulator [Roseomonas nepalensis]TPG59738.1 GntR family transcriptional regulator [Roseomonas nepalensis]
MDTRSEARPAGARRLPRSLSVADELRAAVIAGEFGPGERLQEVRLSKRLGVSRTPVRLALQALAADGLLEHAPRRGYSVRRFDATEILNAFEIRAALEGLAARFAAERGLEEAARARLEAILAEGDALLSRGELPEGSRPAYIRMNAAFHEALHGASGSRMLGEMLRLSQNLPLSSHHHVVAFEYRRVRRRHDDHHRILEAVLRRDARRAENLMCDHVASIKAGLTGVAGP